ncbi:MAG: hypothetical protein KDD50_09345 [Bdellovibrionales bacterium]|nr:hypothetical protein [Bdellovibrionales bacterium]
MFTANNYKKCVYIFVVLIFPLRLFALQFDLEWPKDLSAVEYELQISNYIDFSNIVKNEKTVNHSITLTLPNGIYFYTVRSIYKNKKIGSWSVPRRLKQMNRPPQLLFPKNEDRFIFYEYSKNIEFIVSELKPTLSYELLVWNRNDEIIFKKLITSTKVILPFTIPGEYFWKVRSFTKNSNDYKISEIRKFIIVKEVFADGQLIYPKGEELRLAPYSSLSFKWTGDEQAKFFDVEIYSASGNLNEQFKNLEDKDEITLNRGLPPGKYYWFIKQKENSDSNGVQSEESHFIIYPNPIVKGDLFFEYGLSQGVFDKTYRSQRVSPETEFNIKESVSFNHLVGYYIYGKWSGIGADWLFTQAGENPWKKRFYQVTYNWYFYGGYKYFSNLASVGYRQVVFYDHYDSSSPEAFVVSGISIQNKFSFAIGELWKTDFSLGYFRPQWAIQGTGELDADTFEYSLGLGYNLYRNFWIMLKFSESLNAVRFIHQNADGANVWWALRRTEPLGLSIEGRF